MTVKPTQKRRLSKRPPDHILAEIVMNKAGIVSAVAQALNASPRQVRRWRDGSKNVGRLFREAQEAVLDLAESKLIQNIKAGKTADIIWYLECKGKARGWVERSEVEAVGHSTVRVELVKEQTRLKDPKYREAVRAYFDAAEAADRPGIGPLLPG